MLGKRFDTVDAKLAEVQEKQEQLKNILKELVEQRMVDTYLASHLFFHMKTLNL